jgi:predicted alpha/beta-fold hydrolase
MQPSARQFRPPAALGNRHVQTMLSSGPLRQAIVRRRARGLNRAAQDVLVDAGAGVRLSGRFSAVPRTGTVRGLAVLLHGWEGSSESNYVLETGARLFEDGWDVFRLNLRDHGDSHALNRGLFHSCLIDEVVGAVAQVARQYPQRPLVLAGFSLGGNFALRVALRAPAAGIPLAAVAAVCPVVDPEHSMRAIERYRHVYARYFLMKWRRSLKRKQRLFPDLDLLRPGDGSRDLRDLTRVMTERQTDFGTLENYLDGYSVAGARLTGLGVPTRILTSRDDPVIPVTDFVPLAAIPAIELDIADHGGHCGFIAGWNMRSYCADYLAEWLRLRAEQYAG